MDVITRDATFQAALRGSLAVLAVVGALLLVVYAWAIVQPLIIAIVLATALWPWVSRIASTRIKPFNWRLPRFIAAGLIYVATFATAGAILWIALQGAVPLVGRALESFPEQTAPIREYLEPFQQGDFGRGALQVAEDAAKEVTASKPSNAGESSGNASATNAASAAEEGGFGVASLAVALLGGLFTLALVLVFTFFLLLEGDRFAQWFFMALPRERRMGARMLSLRIRDRISRWVLAQILYALLSGIIVGGGMLLLQVPNPWLYGVAGIMLAVLPSVGPSLAAIPAFIVALSLEPWQPVAVAVFGLVLYIVDSMMVAPKIYGEMLRLPMFIMLLSMLIGATLMGLWGALIAPPVAAAIQMFVHDQMSPASGENA